MPLWARKKKKDKKKTLKNVGLDNTNFASQGESCRASFSFSACILILSYRSPLQKQYALFLRQRKINNWFRCWNLLCNPQSRKGSKTKKLSMCRPTSPHCPLVVTHLFALILGVRQLGALWTAEVWLPWRKALQIVLSFYVYLTFITCPDFQSSPAHLPSGLIATWGQDPVIFILYTCLIEPSACWMHVRCVKKGMPQ